MVSVDLWAFVFWNQKNSAGMNPITIFLFEWKHLIRTPFKLVGLVLFILAAGYGLHNGAALYNKQTVEIEQINEKVKEEKQKYLSYYERGEKGPKNRPWIDMTTPFWALWYSSTYHIKEPSPAMVYSIGQAEQYGYYKQVNFRSSPYDADMAEEIANPERLQSGTLDFSFVALYLLPLLLLICLYNIKGAEADGGFLPLIYSQTGSQTNWLLARLAFYGFLLIITVMGLMLYGAVLTPVFDLAGSAFWQILGWLSAYLLLWWVVFAWIIQRGNTTLGNTLKMVAVWLLFVFIIPATVNQWVSIKYPPNLMTDYIDAKRDKTNQLYEQADSISQAQLDDLFPEIINSPIAKDQEKADLARNRSFVALTNELVKNSISTIESDKEARNSLIRFSYGFNPVSFMQNKLNALSQTHYNDYEQYSREIQSLVDKQIRVLVLDTWNAAVIDQEKYLEYIESWELQ